MTRRDSNEVVEEVRSANDIAAVVGGYVRLRKAGKNYKGLCPFHKEKTPSFIVSPDRQMFHCFGCGKGGDVYRFVMEMDGVRFPEALRTLAQRAGIRLPSTWKGRGQGERERHLRVLEFARDHFQKSLRSRSGEGAARYLRSRGIGDEMVERFRLGYAPDGWRLLRDAAKKNEITDRELVETGLLVSRDQGAAYDRFRNRIVFPIQDVSGRTIGFGGRLLGSGEPKYLNSPETSVFRKGQALYGLSDTKAEIRRTGRAVLVEGYTDVISLYQHGITNVVAPLGTALTPFQARLISNYSDRVVLLYDGDEAGMQATLRSLSTVFGEGLRAVVANMPPGCDPDQLLREEGSEKLQRRIETALPLVSFLLDYPFAGGKEEAVRALVSVLSSVKDEIRLNLLLQEAHDRTGLSEEILFREIGKVRRREHGETPEAVRQAPGVRRRLLDAQRGIAYLGLEHPDLLPVIRKVLKPDEVSDVPARRLLRALYECAEKGEEPSPAILTLAGVDDAFSRIRVETMETEDPLTILHDYLACVREEEIEQRSRRLQLELKDAEERNDTNACMRLLAERSKLAAQRRQIAHAAWGGSMEAEITTGERGDPTR